MRAWGSASDARSRKTRLSASAARVVTCIGSPSGNTSRTIGNRLALDVTSVVESILENPHAVLRKILDKVKGDLVAKWKANDEAYGLLKRFLELYT